MGEAKRRQQWFERFKEVRDRCLRDPTEETAALLYKFSAADRLIPDPQPHTLLAGLHKARLAWNKSTPEMVEQSKQWLLDHGFNARPPTGVGPF
jgi:hypothetical protein